MRNVFVQCLTSVVTSKITMSNNYSLLDNDSIQLKRRNESKKDENELKINIHSSQSLRSKARGESFFDHTTTEKFAWNERVKQQSMTHFIIEWIIATFIFILFYKQTAIFLFSSFCQFNHYKRLVHIFFSCIHLFY